MELEYVNSTNAIFDKHETTNSKRSCHTCKIFPDDDGKMNVSLIDCDGAVLLVSQFTLYGDCRKGRRPSFVRAAHPTVAEPAYERFGQQLGEAGVSTVEFGIFGADMAVELLNDGPVTLVIDSP